MVSPHLFALFVCATLLGSASSSPRAAPGHTPRAPDWVDVRDQGAVGDGVVDDARAFVRAIAAVPSGGGTLYIPRGEYRLGTSLDVERGDITVLCDDGARLVVGAPGVALLRLRKVSGERIADIRVERCTFVDDDPEAHVAVEETHGIILRRADRVTFRDLRFEGIGDESIDVIQSTHVRILDSTFIGGCAAVSSPNVGALSINGSSFVQARGNTFLDNRNGSAIRIEVPHPDHPVRHVDVSANLVVRPADDRNLGGASGSGIVVFAARGVVEGLTLMGNQIVEPWRLGINVNPQQGSARGSAFVIIGNTVIGGGAGVASAAEPVRGAINVAGQSTEGTVVGNVVRGWGAPGTKHPGLRLRRDAFAVGANVVVDVAGPAIRSDGFGQTGNVIVGNVAARTRPTQADAQDLEALNKTTPSPPSP